MKVLIVDEDRGMRGLVRSIIGDLAEVLECEDGAEALALYGLQRPDWVLMEARMDEPGAIEAIRSITRAYPDARVVIITNYDDERLRNSVREAGARDYVLKDDLFNLRWILSRSGDSIGHRGL